MCLKWSFLWLMMATTGIVALITPGSKIARADQTQHRIVYTIPGMDAVRVQRDLTYKRDNGTDLKMDIYLPPAQSKIPLLPGVLLLHGGGLPSTMVSAKDWSVFVSYGQLLAASGLVAVTFNHRFSSPEEVRVAAQDVQDALHYVRDQAESFGLDRDRLCLWAFSGAGVLLTAPLRDRPPYLKCLAAYSAVFDPQYYKVFDPQAYRGGEFTGESDTVSDEVVQQFSPARQLKTGNAPLPPLFIARAGRDHPVLNQYLDLMIREGLTANMVLDVMNHPTGRHNFDIENNDARSREIIARTLSFLKIHLGVQ